jgi:copper chaperone CopZ
MRSFRILVLVPLCVVWLAAAAQAEVKVTVSKSHLCCPMCFKAVDETLSKVDGVKHETNKDAKTITITAADEKGAQAAIDALGKAGFHGQTDVESITFKKVETPEGSVKRLEVSGVHNCCGACNTALKKAVGGVKGVQAETLKPRESKFVVEGDFSAAELVEALLTAGFHCEVK